jgi:type II secretory pathway predicted ATPase ExeA
LSAFIFNPILTNSEFFEYLLADFNIKGDGRSKSQALIKLNSLLLERYRLGQITVLIVDEAQNLSPEILEEIRLLTNLETATEKLLQIVLVGQPELSLKLNSPELRQLKQRISLRCTLDPLTLSETKEYIKTRLEIAGLPDQQIFADTCIAQIYRSSGGIPRLINTICDNALLTGYACDLETISVDIILEVAEDLELTDGYRHSNRGTTRSPRHGGSSAHENDHRNGENPSESSVLDKGRYDSESFDLFVQFVDKLRDRTK